jgi:hypothetical protein
MRDVLHVPLFVKPPFLRAGRVSDRSVESVDILPTIATALEMPLPFAVDGRSMLDPAPPGAADRHARTVGGSWTIDATLPSTWAGVRMKTALFGPHPTWDDVWALSSAPELLGRRVDTMPIDARPALSYALLDAQAFDEVAPASGMVPSYVRGVVWATHADALPGEIAVAVDGVVRGVGRLFSVHDVTEVMTITLNPNATGVFAMMVPEAAFHAGRNRVDAFVVAPDRRLGRMLLGVSPSVLFATWPES